jgi:hypothetical protein
LRKLAEALQPGMSPAVRRQLATAYSRNLRMSTVAEKRGLDKGPTFEEKMTFARMQILSQELTRALQEDSGKVTDGDIEDYYKKNEASYEQATFARILFPAPSKSCLQSQSRRPVRRAEARNPVRRSRRPKRKKKLPKKR